MKPYLITGLPRSRTAWMAAFMDNCVHDPIGRLQRIEDIEQVYREYEGISDSGLGFWLDWILKNIQPRTLIIERPLEDVEASLRALNTGLPETNFCELLQNTLRQFKHHPLVKWVKFEHLNESKVMQQIFWHLCPGRAFDESRFEAMKGTIITVEPDLNCRPPLVEELMPYLRIKTSNV